MNDPRHIPYLVEGEIVKALDFLDTKKSTKTIRYECMVLMPNGSRQLFTNVEMSNMFGGIGDYTQRRGRAMLDNGNNFPGKLDNDSLSPTIGERVIISFLGGSPQKPIIVGFLQHPKQTEEFEDSPVDLDPQAVLQYLGVRIEVSDTGAIRFIKKGAPKIKYTGGGLFGSIPSIPGASTSSSSIKGNNNKALTPADDTEVVLWEMLDEGVFRIRDAEGQMFEMDRTKMRIYISNNDLKSTEDAEGGPLSGGNLASSNSTDAEYILLDKDKELVLINARTTAQIYSFDARKDVTEGTHSHEVGEDSEWTIEGNETVTIDGDQEITVEGDRTVSVTGDQTTEVTGDLLITVEGDVNETVKGDLIIDVTGDLASSITGETALDITSELTVSSLKGITLESTGAVLKLGNGKVGLGGPTAEVLDLMDQTLDAFINNAPTIVATAVGPGALNPAVVALLTTIKTLLGTIKGGI